MALAPQYQQCLLPSIQKVVRSTVAPATSIAVGVLNVRTGLLGIPGAFLEVPITAIMTIVLSEFPGSRPIAVLLSRNGQV